MTVVGAWSAHGEQHRSEEVVRQLSPGCVRTIGRATVGSAEARRFRGSTLEVGEAPTSSAIIATEDGLVLRRGPAWTAPIYYRVDDGTITASSDLAPLVRSGAAIDRGLLACRLANVCHVEETRTIHRGIAKLRPFEELTFGPHGIRSRVTETPPLALDVDPDGLVRELERRILDAVDRAAGSGRVAIMLSGGLDSSTVLAALLARRGRDQVIALTIDFEGAASDRPYVRALEEHFGIDVVRVDPHDAREAMRGALVLDSAPGCHSWDVLGTLCARRAADAGADVMLTGAGGDEVLGGDFALGFGARLRRGDLTAIRDAMTLPLSYPESRWSRLRAVAVPFLRPHVPRWVFEARARRQLARHRWAGPVLQSELERRAARPPKPEGWTPAARYDALAREPLFEPNAESWAQVKLLGGAARRDPLYDEELVRFAMAVPPPEHVSGGIGRSLHRRAMEGHLPDIIRRRVSKADFQVALSAALFPIDDLRELLTFSHLGDAGIVDPDALRAFLQPLLDTPEAETTQWLWLYIWPAIAGEAFLRQHGARHG
jgi:asparagine synthase (glutamine-hydrolysing)